MNIDSRTARAKFRTTWWIATGVLLLMVIVFIVSNHFVGRIPHLDALRAFSEAAMVGGFADWFAVTALFRHPLGLPIPHTAIVPNNKARIGRSLGEFIQENFLSEQVIESEAVNITGAITRWLEKEENRKVVVLRSRELLPHLIDTLEEDEIRKFFDHQAEDIVKQLDLAKFSAKVLRLLTVDELHERVLDEVVMQTRSFFRENREWFHRQVRDASPWFVPDFIDEKIFSSIVEKSEKTFADALSDRNHELRQKVHAAVESFIVQLETSDEFHTQAEEIKNLLLENAVVREYINSIREGIIDNIKEDIRHEDSKLAAALENMLDGFVETMSGSSELQLRLNAILRKLFVTATGDKGEYLIDRIAKTVDSWETETLVQKLEEQVGADLQFIRMNGTIVGGIIGLVIYFCQGILR